MKKNRFLLAEDPRNKSGGLAIIHTIYPKAIIEVVHDHVAEGDHFRQFIYNGPDGPEQITLIITHLFTGNMNALDNQVGNEMVTKLLNRAWHWYKSYLEWEDNNID